MVKLPSPYNNNKYKSQSFDTSQEADLILFELLQQLKPYQKKDRFCKFNQSIRNIVLKGIKSQYPEASINKIREEYIKRTLGEKWITILNKVNDISGFMIEDPLSLAQKIADILVGLDIPYLIGGSVASSLLGESRATQDLDLVIDLSLSQVTPLIQAMGSDFYISESAVIEAIQNKTSFNIIHLLSIEKADLFVMDNTAFSQSKMKRRQFYPVDPQLNQGVYIYSPEDIILQKLFWYNLAKSESQKQWRDVLGVLKIQQDNLDFAYLTNWANLLQLEELLTEALEQSGLK
ncbi:hypothetical protein [Crocosphaera sp. XPORK-15E]|uniref:hypothetical protein n=1 Tax=Crocosphaera sp. XPORK-15E TaxID=3110247 RepID=UPI002B212BCB|nr:hypothetical protein [Crocosphaera sp. XPORK-15E]MEA5536337.1 hypothetical protein [Crocosphaera sp. XPORK-15E]